MGCSGVQVGGRHGSKLHISHLLFAYDNIIYYENDNMVCLKTLGVNLSKSVIIPMGIFTFFSFSLLTLGFHWGLNSKTNLSGPPILDKVQKRLAMWKSKYLSKGARLTLVKSGLSSPRGV